MADKTNYTKIGELRKLKKADLILIIKELNNKLNVLYKLTTLRKFHINNQLQHLRFNLDSGDKR